MQVCGKLVLVAQLVRNLPAVRDTWVRSLGWEDPLEKGKASHSSILAWTSMDCIVNGVAQSQTRLKRPSSSSSLSLLQGIFPTQRSNPGLPHCRWILYQLSHKGSWYFTVGLIYFSLRTDQHICVEKLSEDKEKNHQEKSRESKY